MRDRTKWAIWVGASALALLTAGGYGAWRIALRLHDVRIERRVLSFGEIIRRHARANRLPVELVEAVIRAESGGDPRAVSSKDARGLMQIRAITEREVLRRRGLAKGDLFDPDYNVQIGTAYLRMLLDRFSGDLHLALAGYHLGPSRVQKLRKAHPGLSGRALVRDFAPAVTVRYCEQILGGMGEEVRVGG